MPESHLPSLANYLRTKADLQMKQIPSGLKAAFYNA